MTAPKTNPSRSLQATTRIDVRQLSDFAQLFKNQGSPPRSISETVSRAVELCHEILVGQQIITNPEASTENALRELEQVKLSVVNDRTKTALLNQIRREQILQTLVEGEAVPTIEEQLEALKQIPKTEE